MAGNRKTKRIFLVCQEDISSKTCSKTVKFRETDKIFILTDEEALKLPEGLLDYFDNKEQALSLSGEELIEFLRSTRESDKDIYYFIGSGAKHIYHEIGNDVILFSKGIACNDTFGISKVPIEKPTQSELTDLASSFNSVSASLSMALEESIRDESCNTPQYKKENKVTIQKKSDSEKNRNSVDTKQLSSDTKLEKAFTESNQKKELKTQTKDSDKKNEKNDSTAIEENSSDETELDEPVRLELRAEKEKELTISERCMRTKAAVVACLLERFREHIGIYTKREMEQETCFQFLQLLMKAKNPEDFTSSWKCQEPDSRIALSMDQFLDLKGEALYWYDISNLFYKGDLWNF